MRRVQKVETVEARSLRGHGLSIQQERMRVVVTDVRVPNASGNMVGWRIGGFSSCDSVFFFLWTGVFSSLSDKEKLKKACPFVTALRWCTSKQRHKDSRNPKP